MYILQTDPITNLANRAIIGACVLSIGFMLRFLIALARERKTSRRGLRLEYRLNGSSPNAAVRRTWRRLPVQVMAQSSGTENVGECDWGGIVQWDTSSADCADQGIQARRWILAGQKRA